MCVYLVFLDSAPLPPPHCFLPLLLPSCAALSFLLPPALKEDEKKELQSTALLEYFHSHFDHIR